jgi:SAM-dependent methyltransferase
MRELPVDDYSVRLVAHWNELQGDEHYAPAAEFIAAEIARGCLPRRVFELGCGTGLLADHLCREAGLSVRAWDRSPAMRSRADERFRALDGMASWLDPHKPDALEGEKTSFGAFVSQRMAPTAEELVLIAELAGSLVAPGGCILISYWTGQLQPSGPGNAWPAVDISNLNGSICVRLNEWDFTGRDGADSWRYVCLYWESGVLDLEHGVFALPKISDEDAAVALSQAGLVVESHATQELQKMGVRCLARQRSRPVEAV